ncbi:hypothetical protein MUN77_01410 [Leucobacter allii]|uniref:hypothetical protein n=1 Tax=Leucobacter allii TaxID=2932247 RepID=UPI001FD5036B|nr:hypothetical protein [Leucobacter allii]UOR02018.1 hypothetical protein MUN77_01410 [Leucobacter allii]
MTNPIDQIRPHGGAASEATKIEQARAVAEVAAAIQVAQQFPRSAEIVRAEMRELCGSYDVASEAFYAVPNRGSGMSVHLARELARIFRNIDYGVRELSRDSVNGQSEIQAWAWDQQANTRTTRSFIQPHAKSTRKGQVPLVDLNDIYLSNQNTGAKAVRECIFGVLPGWLKAEATKLLNETLERGNGQSIEQRREQAVGAFTSLRVTAAQLEQRVKRKYDQWQPEDIAELERVYMAVTRDGIAITEFFPQEPVQLPQAAAQDPA